MHLWFQLNTLEDIQHPAMVTWSMQFTPRQWTLAQTTLFVMHASSLECFHGYTSLAAESASYCRVVTCQLLKYTVITKVAGNLLHESSYRGSNIIHTEHWSIVGWTACKTLPFCFGSFLITSCVRRKDTRLSPRYIFTFRESLGMRLPDFYATEWNKKLSSIPTRHEYTTSICFGKTIFNICVIVVIVYTSQA